MKKNSVMIGRIILIIGIVGILILLLSLVLSHKGIISEDISSLSVEYAPLYNFETAQELNANIDGDFIQIQKLELTNSQISKIKKYLKKIQKDDEFYKCECVVNDEVLITINGKNELAVGEKFGEYRDLGNDTKTVVGISDSFYQYISKLVEEKNSNIFQEIEAQDIQITRAGETYPVESKRDIIQIVSNLRYFPVSIYDNYETYNGGYHYVVNFGDQYVLYLYGTMIGYLQDNTLEEPDYYYVIIDGDIYDIVDNLFESYSN